MCITNANVAVAVTAWTSGDATTYGNIVEWNTAAVTSMASVFASKPTFNADISKWNVASVSSMASAFSGASAFNANLASWNTASVTTMYQACFLLRFGALMMCGGACRSYWVVGALCSELEQHARCVGCACRCLGSAGHRCSSD